MGSITSADIEIVSELKIRYITALELLLEAQQHGRCRVRGVPADGEEAQWQLAGGRDIPAAVTGRDDGVTEILFSGIIKEGKVYSENGLSYVELELVTASDLLDRERRQRSFQNIHMTYEQAVRQILEPYGAGVICAKEARAALGTPLIQYGETDWEFILRLGSRIHLPVFADCVAGKPQFYFGMREGNCFNEKLADYHVGISARYYEADEACSIARGGFLYYSITGDARYEMGDRIETGAGSFTVFRKYIELRQEVLRCTHWMGHPGNWYIPAAAHRQLAGMEFTGIVTDTHAEKLKLRLDMDGEQGGAEYEWDWTPVTGNMLYAMPEKGTRVRMAFGSEEASEGTADACVRKNGADMPGQQERMLTTAAGKQLVLRPGSISMGGDGGRAQISDGSAVSLGSAKYLRMTAAGAVYANAKNIRVRTPQELNLYRSPSVSAAKLEDVTRTGTWSGLPEEDASAGDMLCEDASPIGNVPACQQSISTARSFSREKVPFLGKEDSGFTMSFEFNGLSRSGLLCGTDFITYRPFQDAPEEVIPDTKPSLDEGKLGTNVIIGSAAVLASAVVVSCAAAAAVGSATAAAPIVLGLMTITCGCSMVEGLARTDRQIGSVSPWTSYVGNAFKGANMGLMAGASFVNVPYGAEMLAAELAPAGLIVNVGNTYVRGETLITAAMNAATFTNMMLACNETHAYASGENALAELMGQDTYELARDAASAGSAMTLMAAMCNPRMYGYGSETNNIRQMAGYDNGEEGTKPNQVHHYATDKNRIYTPQFDEIANKYGLDLDSEWNKGLLPHQGRHPNAYHEYVLDSMKQFDEIAKGNRDVFLKLYENLKKNIQATPDMLYKSYWN